MTKHEDHMTTKSVTAASSAERLESEVPLQWIPPSAIPMIAGGLGGIVSTTLLLPLDIVKLRLQVTEGSADPHRRFRHFRSLRIIGGIWKYEGLPGFYQGWTPAVLGSSISWGGYFFFYEGMKRQYMQYGSGRGSSDLTSVEHFVLACGAGAIMVGLTNPIWLVKTRMQLQLRRAQQSHSTIPPYRNMFDAFSTIVREEGGWKALYKGAGPALLLTSHGGVQFVVYEYLRKHPSWFQWSSRATSDDTSATPKTVWLRLEQSAGYLTMGALAKM
jgi:solute carrier family 25 (mitochondrial folate transporter), member 32